MELPAIFATPSSTVALFISSTLIVQFIYSFAFQNQTAKKLEICSLHYTGDLAAILFLNNSDDMFDNEDSGDDSVTKPDDIVEKDD